jgi:hypothetical protein
MGILARACGLTIAVRVFRERKTACDALVLARKRQLLRRMLPVGWHK